MPHRASRAYLTNGPIGGGSVICEGSFAEACRAVWALPLDQRHAAHVHTEGYDYSPDELEDMRPADDYDEP